MNLSNLRLPEFVRQNLASRGWTSLLPAQREMLPLLLDDVPFSICAHGGSGKRTALCAGLAARLAVREGGRLRRGRRARAVVITGTAALGSSICECFDSLVLGSRLVSLHFGAGRHHDRQRRLGLGVDLVVGPAGALLQQEKTTPGWLDDVEMLFIADARSLLDEKDGPEALNDVRNLLALLERREGRGRPVLSLLSNHWSKEVEALAGELSPGVRHLRIGARFAAPAVLERFLLVGRVSKMRSLIEEVRTGGRDRRTLICCDRRRVDGVCAAFEKEGFSPVILEAPQGGMIEGLSVGEGGLAVTSFVTAAALPAGSFDLVCLFRPPETPEAYETIARLAAFRATVERPWCGQLFMLVSSDQLEDFRSLGVQLSYGDWTLEPLSIRLLNPLPDDLVDSGAGIARRRALCIKRVHEDLCEAGHLGEPQEVPVVGKKAASAEPVAAVPHAAEAEPVPEAAGSVPAEVRAEEPEAGVADEALLVPAGVRPAEVSAGEAARTEPPAAEAEPEAALQEAAGSVPAEVRAEEPEAEVADEALLVPAGVRSAEVPADEAVRTEPPAAKAEPEAALQEAAEGWTEVQEAATADEETFEPEADRSAEVPAAEVAALPVLPGESGAVFPDEEPMSEDAGDGIERETVPAHRRTLTIRADYVPRREQAPTVTITEPLSSNTVELRAAQERMRRAMRGGEKLTHQMVGRRGTIRRPKRDAALPVGEVEGILAAQPGARLPGEKRSRKGQKGQKDQKNVRQVQEKAEKRRNARRQAPQSDRVPAFDYAASEALTVPGLTAAPVPSAMPPVDADERPVGRRRRKQKSVRKPDAQAASEARKQGHPAMRNGRRQAVTAGEAVRQADAAVMPATAPESAPLPSVLPEAKRGTPPVDGQSSSAGPERSRRNGKSRKSDRSESGRKNEEGRERARTKRKPKSRPASPGTVMPGGSAGWNDDADDNFGNSINYKPVRKARTDVMPWQTAEAYGLERPQGLSFAQMTPFERGQREGLSTSYLGLADPRRSRPQEPDGRPGDGRKHFNNRFRKSGSRNSQDGQKGRRNRRGKGEPSGQGGVPGAAAG